jgi:arylsulfatase A-like enzyme
MHAPMTLRYRRAPMSKPLLDRRWPWLAGAALLIAGMIGLLSLVVDVQFGGVADTRPVGGAEDIERLAERSDLNLVFILIDTLRADRLGSYGYERDTSPTIDRYASTGIRFGRHLSQASWTKASMASFWTGYYPARNGVTRSVDLLAEDAVMPAEILREAGFFTVGLYRNGWVAPNFGFGQGFDVYVRPPSTLIPPRVRFENPTISTHGTDEGIVQSAVEFLRVHGHKRFFLYVHMMDVHEYVYDEEAAQFGGTYSDIYDNAILWEDHVVGALLDLLADRGLAEKTLVVIGADHGEAFRERGVEGHARRVFRETTEVPLFLILPFRLEPGAVVQSRTRNVDVWPTVLDLLGLDVPPGLDGRSMRPEILAAVRGQAATGPEAMGIAHLDQNWGQQDAPPAISVAVADGSHRYVRSEEAGRVVEQLFDARLDPLELEDRADTEPAELERLRAVADAYLEESPPWGAAPTRDIDELELNQLRALGYALP